MFVQLLKLAVFQAIPDLSDPYVVWDMDMIPARQIPLVYLPSPHISFIGASDSLQLPQGSSVMSVHGQPVRTVVNVGGAWSEGYGLSYEKLLHTQYGTDFSSFTHEHVLLQTQFVGCNCIGISSVVKLFWKHVFAWVDSAGIFHLCLQKMVSTCV